MSQGLKVVLFGETGGSTPLRECRTDNVSWAKSRSAEDNRVREGIESKQRPQMRSRDPERVSTRPSPTSPRKLVHTGLVDSHCFQRYWPASTVVPKALR